MVVEIKSPATVDEVPLLISRERVSLRSSVSYWNIVKYSRGRGRKFFPFGKEQEKGRRAIEYEWRSLVTV